MTHTFVLVPGAGGQAANWSLVVPLLAAAGHTPVAVDLPAAEAEAGLPEYVAAVVAAAAPVVADHADQPVAIVAQSMGAFTAVMAAGPLDASLLVLVNAMIPTPGETPGEWWDNTGHPRARRQADIAAGRDPDAAFDPMSVFLHDVPRAVHEAAPAPEQSDGVFVTRCDIGRWPDVATHVVVGRDDRFFPADFQTRIARDRLGITPDVISGGHLLSWANPTGLVNLLLSYG